MLSFDTLAQVPKAPKGGVASNTTQEWLHLCPGKYETPEFEC